MSYIPDNDGMRMFPKGTAMGGVRHQLPSVVAGRLLLSAGDLRGGHEGRIWPFPASRWDNKILKSTTHSERNETAPVHLDRKCWYFDSNFIDVYCHWCSWQLITAGSRNGLSPVQWWPNSMMPVCVTPHQWDEVLGNALQSWMMNSSLANSYFNKHFDWLAAVPC